VEAKEVRSSSVGVVCCVADVSVASGCPTLDALAINERNCSHTAHRRAVQSAPRLPSPEIALCHSREACCLPSRPAGAPPQQRHPSAAAACRPGAEPRSYGAGPTRATTSTGRSLVQRPKPRDGTPDREGPSLAGQDGKGCGSASEPSLPLRPSSSSATLQARPDWQRANDHRREEARSAHGP